MRVAYAACEAIGTLASDRGLADGASEGGGGSSLVALVVRALSAHGGSDREMALSACYALRLLCGLPSSASATQLAELRASGGEAAVQAVVEAHRLPQRSTAAELLDALRGRAPQPRAPSKR